MAKRERRRESPAKNGKKKRNKDDPEPPAGGAPGAASTRNVSAPREKGAGVGEGGPDGLPGERCRDRADEWDVSQEEGSYRRAFLSHAGAAAAGPATARLKGDKGPRIPGRHCHFSRDGAALREKERAKTFKGTPSADSSLRIASARLRPRNRS